MTINEIMDDIDQLLSSYRDLHPRGQQYVRALIELLEQDADGTLLSFLGRHKAGERVADEYLDLNTGERVTLGPEEDLGLRWVPLLKALNPHFSGECVTEWSQVYPVGCPISNCEDNLREVAPKVRFQSRSEI